MAEFERDYLANLLRSSRGDITAAAESADVPKGTLYRLMKKHNLSAAEFRSDP